MSLFVFIRRAKINFHLRFIVASSHLLFRIFIADRDSYDFRPVNRSNWVGKRRIEWKDAQERMQKELQSLETET